MPYHCLLSSDVHGRGCPLSGECGFSLSWLLCFPNCQAWSQGRNDDRPLQVGGGSNHPFPPGQAVCPLGPQKKRWSRTAATATPSEAAHWEPPVMQALGSHLPECFPIFCFSLCLRVMLSLSLLRFSWKTVYLLFKYPAVVPFEH